MSDTGTDLNTADAVAALERFVVDNDDLLELERRIGRFNIFDALRIVNAEIRHSNFLAWLLDPNESHNLGPLFLRAVLMDLWRQSEPRHRPAGLSPITLDGGDLRGVEIRREWQNIDLLIRCDEPQFVIAIENKIRSGEHSDQLERYKETVRKQLGDVPQQFVFLTPEGDEPSDDDWTGYDYGCLHDVLQRVIDANRSAIGDDVLAFVEHYLNILRSKLMDDPQIDELCRRIYQNHRQAIDLIVERVGTSNASSLIAMEETINEDPDWQLIKRTSKRIQCIPKCWALPEINKRKQFPANAWLFVEIRLNQAKCKCVSLLRASPTTDTEIRQKIIGRLVENPKEFGLKTFFKDSTHMGTSWTAFGRTTVFSWAEDDPPDDSVMVKKVMAHLAKRLAVLEQAWDAMRPIIDEWERDRST